ncbi:alpha/beta-hydrolase [Lojkania enalia]|uniref:Carboxylic ester hydrolase n=1 Tax=Lojkania enalia TaxID=147567 RepID=A0A9P4NB41_9PLEO|nr:alpha/beta-hydrolase [Didymosphaeria enalia]
MWNERSLKWGYAPLKNVLSARHSSPSGLRFRLLAIMLFVAIALMLFSRYGFGLGRALPYSKDPESPMIVSLPNYGEFKGTQILTTVKYGVPLQESVDAWLGIEYATQPVGERRFQPADWPEPFAGTKDAGEYGPSCVQNSLNGLSGQSEACLNFNVYRTAGVPLSEKLPVLVWIHGGSFVGGSGRSLDGAAFVAASSEPLVVITIQYRLGALGSLPSLLFEEEDLLNLGIRDQRLCLEFIQEYVGHFGGNRDAITLGGQSAGAHSVGIQYFHNYDGDDEPLFRQAIMASGAPTARAFPDALYPLYQRQFDEFMYAVNCPVSPNEDALVCLRGLDVRTIQWASTRIYNKYDYNITWAWQPVSPGPLLEKRGSQSGIDGTFFHLPLLISSTTDEGKLFTPTDLTTNAEFLDFMSNLAPGLTDADLDLLESLYPDPNKGHASYANAPQSAQYDRLSAAYGDYSYICPVQETAYRISAAGPPVYKARFNTPNWSQAWQGVPHASDSWYFNGLENAQYPEIAALYHSYYVSFVVAGDPNKFAIEGAPKWGTYEGVGGEQLVVGNEERGGVYMEPEAEGVRMEQCAYWRDEGRMKRLNK